MRGLWLFTTVVGIFLSFDPALAAMSSASYRIRWDAVDSGGLDTASSSSYRLRDSIGATAFGYSSGSTYNLGAGYRHGIFDETLEFTVGAIAESSGAIVSSRSGNVIAMPSTSGFSTGNFVVLITDRASQSGESFGMGKIISITSTSVTLDSLTTGPSAPNPDGNGDYLYLVSGSAAALGQISSSFVNSTVIAWSVSTEAQNGYGVYAQADGGLRTAAHTLIGVSDGVVSAGSEEYGARSSDTTLADSTFDSQDTATNTSAQLVASRSSRSYESKDFLVLKASRASDTTGGSYSQTLSLIAASNF